MTGSSSKLLQIQGKWYQDRKKKTNLRQKKTKPEAKKIPKTILHPWPWQLRPSTSMRYFPAAGRCRCRCQDLANVWATWRSQCRELWANVFWESWGCRCQKRWWGGMPSETYLETSEGKKTCGFPGQIATWNPTFPIPALQQTPQKLSKNHLPSMAPSIKSPGFISADGRPLGSGRHLRDRGALPWGPAAGGGAAVAFAATEEACALYSAGKVVTWGQALAGWEQDLGSTDFSTFDDSRVVLGKLIGLCGWCWCTMGMEQSAPYCGKCFFPWWLVGMESWGQE